MIEQLKFVLRSISKRKKRAALTMLGVFIGIAAVVALVSLGQGLQKTINDQFESVGADKIIIQAKEMGFTGEGAPGELTIDDLDVIDRVNGVAQTVGMLFRGAKIRFNDIQRTNFVMSMPETKREGDLAYESSTWEIENGRALTHRDGGKVVVGYNLANKEVFGKNVHVGSKILVEGDLFDVVGTFKRTGDPGMDGGVLMPERDIRRLLNVPDSFGHIVAQTVKTADPDDVAQRIEKAMRRDRHLKEGKEDFSVQTATELIESFNQVLNIIQVVFVGIAAISLLVGGIGIMNTMFTAVLERTKEIGVMKAIGARNRDILTIFLLESALLGFVGGLIGLAIGAGISTAVSFFANSAFGPNTINAYYPMYLIVGVLLFSVLVGAISGVLPARRASKLKPVDALRYE